MKTLAHWCRNIEWSLKRLICYVGCTTLTYMVIRDAMEPGLMPWYIYLAYPFGCIMFYSPQLALTVFKIYKGLPEGNK